MPATETATKRPRAKAAKPVPPKGTWVRKNHGRNHSYHRVIDDLGATQKVPGVTTIIGDGLPKPALIGWAAGTVADLVADTITRTKDGHYLADELIDTVRELAIEAKRPLPERLSRTAIAKALSGLPNSQRDKAGNRGTEVHNLAQRLAEGEAVTPPEELKGHVDAYLRFRDEWEPYDEQVELPVFSRKHLYGGTLDLACRFGAAPELGLSLVDIKTSRSGPFGEVALQLAAYRFADFYVDDDGTEVPMPTFDSVHVLWLRADGYDLYPVEADVAEHRAFLYVQQVAMFAARSRDLIGDSRIPPQVKP